MEFAPSLSPSERWFMGRVFLEKSKVVLEKYKDKKEFDTNELIKILSEVCLGRINIIRGIRLCLNLTSWNVEKPDILANIEEVKKKINDVLFNKLYETYKAIFEVKYLGLNKDKSNYIFEYQNKKIEYNIESEECVKILNKAITERLNNLETLLEIARDIFFEVYVEDRAKELVGYLFSIKYETLEEFYEDLIINECVDLIEEIIIKNKRFPDEIDINYRELLSGGTLELFRAWHHEYFWEWDEKNTVLYSHTED